MATTYEQILGIEGPVVGSNCFGTTPRRRIPIVSPIPAIDPSIGGQSGKAVPTPTSIPQSKTVSQAPSQTKPNEIAERIRNNVTVAEAPGKTKNGGAEQPEQPQQRVLSYEEMFRILNPERPETPEEKAKREKKEKREAIFAALGDGISALSNLFFTTKGAPNAYDPTQGMSAKARERWDRLNAKRDADRRVYSEGLLRAMQLDDANRKDERNWKHTIERERISDERYEVKAAQEKAMADLNEKLKNQQITEAEYKAEQARIKAQFAEENEKLEQEYIRAGIKQRNAAAGASNASANSSNARADYYRNGGEGGNRKGPTLQLEDDEPMQFGDDKDYDRTVMRLAPEYGVPTTTVEVTEWGKQWNQKTKTHDRVPKKQRTVQRPVKDIAADIEREAAKRKKEDKKDYTNTKKLGL